SSPPTSTTAISGTPFQSASFQGKTTEAPLRIQASFTRGRARWSLGGSAPALPRWEEAPLLDRTAVALIVRRSRLATRVRRKSSPISSAATRSDSSALAAPSSSGSHFQNGAVTRLIASTRGCWSVIVQGTGHRSAASPRSCGAQAPPSSRPGRRATVVSKRTDAVHHTERESGTVSRMLSRSSRRSLYSVGIPSFSQRAIPALPNVDTKAGGIGLGFERRPGAEHSHQRPARHGCREVLEGVAPHDVQHSEDRPIVVLQDLGHPVPAQSEEDVVPMRVAGSVERHDEWNQQQRA